MYAAKLQPAVMCCVFLLHHRTLASHHNPVLLKASSPQKLFVASIPWAMHWHDDMFRGLWHPTMHLQAGWERGGRSLLNNHCNGVTFVKERVCVARVVWFGGAAIVSARERSLGKGPAASKCGQIPRLSCAPSHVKPHCSACQLGYYLLGLSLLAVLLQVAIHTRPRCRMPHAAKLAMPTISV